ncbi:hypothetical protein [Psychrobacter sp. LV10R520-6]|uniref:hypothetical protein n=1 Tax=Psychrobacter sp. LV10R520-6 TaxID=1415574 RepID=UPI0024C991D8|nr:hypothetical protein [Psychrobacter sp. LV10R520-6]SNT69250.1 hypothetical protein SAMN04488491_0322 [Psychrobacter sp. LV10R520-6]
MSMLLGVGVLTTITVFYLGKKGWQALHKAVGITPGVLTYHDPQAPITLTDMTWQNLTLNNKHLSVLADSQLRQLQRIDHKVATYQGYQQHLQAQNITPAITEQQFVLDKLLHTRLAEMLASHYHLAGVNGGADATTSTDITSDKGTTNDRGVTNDKGAEAGQLLQAALNNIDSRLDELLEQVDSQHLQDLRVMKNYIDSHNAP